ncbi:uncharacterized protein EI97DRAFT_235139 [Westerdykella ornata]|uniref:Uncharacterized protein n=1 Tax=Westerdykella ornata TaxID=318751 RepID=A0A6A6J823_WESOR|nr:uncharacterized protein EI97DRAFT_235139 [Westerdykella ornata]KAF2272148.1 hypothetical protein EI97DRAFT_235139 [Westerdykella ornata]
MAFRQSVRPQPSRQISIQPPSPEVGPVASPQRKRALEESEEWVLFSPGAPSTIARTHTTSTERTPRTAGLSRFSDFGSLDTAARSQDDDGITIHGTEEGELDSLDDGLHAFHEPSEYGAVAGRLLQSGETVLPAHDGLGTFQPDMTTQEYLWQFERQAARRPRARRRSSVQRRLDALESAEELNQDQESRLRIEKWRLEQSKALLEEIEKETRRRRRLSIASGARASTKGTHRDTHTSLSRRAQSATDDQSVSSEESTESLSFLERLTRRVIRGLMGIDEDTLSVIFGESLPQEATLATEEHPPTSTSGQPSPSLDGSSSPADSWEYRLLERVARELGILVSQLSEHPGAFSTYRRTQAMPEYAGHTSIIRNPALGDDTLPSTTSPSSPTAPSTSVFSPQQVASHYSEASLWGIEEEPEVDPLDSFRTPAAHVVDAAEDLAREREYWERELDVKMVFNFLVQRFSSRRPSVSSQHEANSGSPSRRRHSSTTAGANTEALSARRAAVIRQHHPLVGNAERSLPTSSSHVRDARRRDSLYRQHLHHPIAARGHTLRSSSSCASQSTKKSKHSATGSRNYWDLGGSVGSGSVLAGEV